jgi:two-component system cell cycle sensor histidine kinase/response regulator CckA
MSPKSETSSLSSVKDHVVSEKRNMRGRHDRRVTKKKEWEIAAALKLIFAEHPLPMWIFDKDTFRFLAVNEATLAKYGYSREEFLQMRLADLYPTEQVSSVLECLAGMNEVGKSSPWRHRLKDGSMIDVETTIHTINLAGRKGILTISQDVTARKAEESKREETATYLRALIENCPLAVVVYGTDGQVQMCNPAFEALFLYRQEEIAGSHLDALVAAPEFSAEAEQITKSTVAGKVRHLTTRRRRKDGTVIDVEILGVPLTIHGKLAGGYGIYQDIRDRKRLEEQLQFAQKMQAVGRLAGGIAHDFNNIMGVIQGYSEFLLDSVKPDHPMRTSIEEIDKAARRAVALTSQLLAFSRKQVLQLEVLDVNSVLGQMKEMLRRLIREDIQLDLLPGTDIGWVKADPIHLEQVVLNLVTNARDAMPNGGRLAIETGKIDLGDDFKDNFLPMVPGRYVMLTVSDTGTGMDADTLKNVFEPFFTTKEQGKGTGLGLATVYGIVQQSGGYIFATSELGRGTTFTIYLPRVEEPAPVCEVKKAEKRTPRGTESVLLVEDEDSFRRLVRKFLEQFGYVVLEAKDGKSALRISDVFPGPIHLVLTDVVMPNMGGYELVQGLASRRPASKVLFMSGYAANTNLPAYIQDSGAVFIQKPFSRDALAIKLREVMGAKS